jgi:hypothetical protein
VRTTLNNTAVLNFTSTTPAAQPFLGFPYFVDYFGAEAACEEFILHAKENSFHSKQKDSHQYVARHLFIHGLVKSGKSTVLNTVFPAVARRHFPKALFWRVELALVSHILTVTLPLHCRYFTVTCTCCHTYLSCSVVAVARQTHCTVTAANVQSLALLYCCCYEHIVSTTTDTVSSLY